MFLVKYHISFGEHKILLSKTIKILLSPKLFNDSVCDPVSITVKKSYKTVESQYKIRNSTCRAHTELCLKCVFGFRLDLFCPSGLFARTHGLMRTEATPALYSVIKTGTRIQNTAEATQVMFLSDLRC